MTASRLTGVALFNAEQHRAQIEEAYLQAQIDAFGSGIAPSTPFAVLMVNGAGTDYVQVPLLTRGTNAARPTAGTVGRWYQTSDNPRAMWYDDGSKWQLAEPAFCLKTVQTDLIANATLTIDPELSIPILAGQIMKVEANLIVNGANDVMDFKYDWSIPTAASEYYGTASGTSVSGFGGGVSTTTNPVGLLTSSNQSLGTKTGGGLQGISLRAIILNNAGGAVDGNVKLRYCQAVSDAGTLSVMPGSSMEAWAY